MVVQELKPSRFPPNIEQKNYEAKFPLHLIWTPSTEVPRKDIFTLVFVPLPRLPYPSTRQLDDGGQAVTFRNAISSPLPHPPPQTGVDGL